MAMASGSGGGKFFRRRENFPLFSLIHSASVQRTCFGRFWRTFVRACVLSHNRAPSRTCPKRHTKSGQTGSGSDDPRPRCKPVFPIRTFQPWSDWKACAYGTGADVLETFLIYIYNHPASLWYCTAEQDESGPVWRIFFPALTRGATFFRPPLSPDRCTNFPQLHNIPLQQAFSHMKHRHGSMWQSSWRIIFLRCVVATSTFIRSVSACRFPVRKWRVVP